MEAVRGGVWIFSGIAHSRTFHKWTRSLFGLTMWLFSIVFHLLLLECISSILEQKLECLKRTQASLNFVFFIQQQVMNALLFLPVSVGQAAFFVFCLSWTCRELCLTLPYFEKTCGNLHTCCAALTPRPYSFGEMQGCSVECLALMIEW